jgi:iron-sulfur cluster assembly protein
MNITFTAAACDYIKKMVEKEQGAAFRLSVKKTGCSGYSYLPAIVQEINPADTKLTLANGTTVFVDPMWQHLLEGVQVDYVEEDKNGLKQKRLLFTNPNETNRCGCGESFHV